MRTDTAIEDEARERLVLLTSGRATERDLAALKRWCGQSERHARAFAEANRLWDGIAAAAPFGGPLGRPPARTYGRRALVIAGSTAAAAAVGYCVVRPPLALWPSVSEYRADVRTGTGERRQLALTDVVVDLNTRTSVNLRRDGNEVELVTGEAAIATARPLAAPLTVVAAGGRLQVSDGQFNLRCDDGQRSVVTCRRGSVAIEGLGAAVTLREGQQTAYAHGALEAAVTVDPAVVMAWRDGQLVFRRTPLSQVIDEINRYRPGRIVVMNAALGRRPVEARVALDRTDDLIVLVHEAYGAHVTRLPAGIVVLS